MFGGPRDSAWTHIRVEGGSREDARAFLPAARKLLGMVKETAAATKLGVLQVRQPINGGGELVGRIVGAIPHVTIKLPRFPPKEDDRVVLDGFVCWPRTLERPDGAGDLETSNFDYPQMVLSPPSKETRQRKWWTFTYERFDTFWQAIKGGKQVYKTRGAVDLIPAGLRRYGNHYWRGSDDVVLSWYAPESGCIINGVEAFLFLNDDPEDVFDYPQAFYSTKVFHFGKTLVDVSVFPGTTRLYVGGACVRKAEDGQTWLYVAQWEGVDSNTFFRAFSVYRYKLSLGTPRPGFIETTVDVLDPEVRELVFSATLPTAAPDFGRAWHHPIRFNQSGTKLVVYVPAGDPFESGSFTSASVLFKTFAYRERDARLTYTVDTGAVDIAYLQLATNTLGSAAIAGDYRDDELVEIRVEAATPYLGALSLGNSYSAGSYVIGEERIPIAEQGADGNAVRRDIVALAPGEGRALFLRTSLTQPPNHTFRSCALELWGENGVIGEWPVGDFDGTGLGVSNLGNEGAGFAYNYVDRPIDAFTVRKGTDPYGFDGAVETFPGSAVIHPMTAVETFPIAPNNARASFTRKHAETIFNPYPATGYQPFLPTNTHRVRFTTNPANALSNGAFVYTAANGGFHGDRPDNEKKLSTRALVRQFETTLVAYAKPPQTDESIVRIAPQGDAPALTGFDGAGFRIHPVVPFGTPIFRTT